MRIKSSLRHIIKVKCKSLILLADDPRNCLCIDYFGGGNGIARLSHTNALRYQIEIAQDSLIANPQNVIVYTIGRIYRA